MGVLPTHDLDIHKSPSSWNPWSWSWNLRIYIGEWYIFRTQHFYKNFISRLEKRLHIWAASNCLVVVTQRQSWDTVWGGFHQAISPTSISTSFSFMTPQGTLNVPRVRQVQSKWLNHVTKVTYLMKDLNDIHHLTKQLNTLSKVGPPGP